MCDTNLHLSLRAPVAFVDACCKLIMKGQTQAAWYNPADWEMAGWKLLPWINAGAICERRAVE